MRISLAAAAALSLLALSACGTSDLTTDSDNEFMLQEGALSGMVISAPANGALVSGVVKVVGKVSVTEVGMMQFFLDGTKIGTDQDAPWEISIDTSKLSPGMHHVSAKGRTETEQWRCSAGVDFKVTTGTDTAPDPEPAPTPTPTPTPSTGALSWRPPTLESPITVRVTNEYRSIKLDKTRDYILQMPTTPLTAGGITVYGGKNVVLKGGEIRPSVRSRGLYVQAWTGTFHVEGLAITGTNLSEGINVDSREPNSILQLQNIYVDQVQGSRDTNHADIFQVWAGPRELRVDRLTGHTTYQGFMLQPMQFGDTAPRIYDFRNVDMHHSTEGGGYMIFKSGTNYPTEFSNVYLYAPNGDYTYNNGHNRLSGYVAGRPSTSFAPRSSVGLNYVSPGYR